MTAAQTARLRSRPLKGRRGTVTAASRTVRANCRPVMSQPPVRRGLLFVGAAVAAPVDSTRIPADHGFAANASAYFAIIAFTLSLSPALSAAMNASTCL